MNIPFIDLKQQYNQIKESVTQRIQNVLEHSQFIMGPEVKELEDKLAQFVGTSYAIGCSSGTDALLLSLMALDIKPGDEIIIPDFSFFATAEVVSFIGAKPVFVDIKPDTYNIDPKEVERHINSNTKAIIAVSLYGQCADFDELNKFNIPVIEDGAQSFGATQNNKRSCGLSTIGCTSFFPSKPLGCYGDGGAVFTNDQEIALKIKQLLAHGQTERYTHSSIGMNGRLDTLQAAVLLEKLQIFDNEISLRQKVATRYDEALKEFIRTPKILGQNTSVFAQYTIETDDRANLQKQLKEKGIPTAIHYPKPLSQQPVYKGMTNTIKNPVSLNASKRVLSLPFSPYLGEDQQEYIIKTVLDELHL